MQVVEVAPVAKTIASALTLHPPEENIGTAHRAVSDNSTSGMTLFTSFPYLVPVFL